MKEDGMEGASGAKTSNIAASEAPGRERRMTARRKQEAVLRVLRGEPLETVAREIGVTVAYLSGWRDRFLDGGAASLKSRPRDDRGDRINTTFRPYRYRLTANFYRPRADVFSLWTDYTHELTA